MNMVWLVHVFTIRTHTPRKLIPDKLFDLPQIVFCTKFFTFTVNHIVNLACILCYVHMCRKPGLTVQYEGHFGTVTSVSCHRATHSQVSGMVYCERSVTVV